MKKVVGFSAILAAYLFAACSDKENSYNFAQVVYPADGNMAVLYADETTDSIWFATTYDWVISCSDNWLSVKAENLAMDVPDGYYDYEKFEVVFEPNTTGENRDAAVYVAVNNSNLVAFYRQLAYLDISRPARWEGQNVLQDTARQVRDSLVFQTYCDDWTLAFKGEAPTWVRLAADAPTSGAAGEYVVRCELDENTGATEREAVLELKSNGITNEIKIRQAAKETEG